MPATEGTEMTNELATAPLVVFRDVALCDGRCGGELTLVTDGITGLAISPDRLTEQTALLRDGAGVSCACPRECGGVYRWRLDEPGTWTSDLDALDIVRASDRLDIA